MKSLVLAALPCLGLLGCFGTSTPAPGPAPVVVEPADGTLVVDWTINNASDPAECNQSAVSNIDVTVEAADGALVGEFQEDCRTFATSIPLAPGSYVATAVLIDGAGQDRTTPVAMDPFTIRGNDDLSVPIDFPSSSFR
jgi:hypothetical protein